MEHIKFSPSNHKNCSTYKEKQAYLFLPPFPGLYGKNEDIARTICEETQIDAFVFNYTGLASNPDESFDFIQSVEESIQFCKDLLSQYDLLHLIGHSWGGLISLHLFNNILTSEQRGLLILLAPFTDFPKDGSIESWLIPMAEKQEFFSFSHKNPLDVRHNFFAVEKVFPPRQNLDRLKTQDDQITIVEAINDPDVPNHSTESLYHLLNQQQNVQRYRLQDDHCFTQNRDAIIDVIRIAQNINSNLINQGRT